MSGFNYSKWDNLALSDEDDSNGDDDPSSSAVNNTVSFDFEAAAALFSDEKPRKALNLYTSFLNSFVTPTPSLAPRNLPTTSARLKISSAPVTHLLLLRLYTNIAACHLSLGEHSSVIAFAGAATEVEVKPPIPNETLHLRATAYYLCGKSQLALATRPHLLRAKSNFKAADDIVTRMLSAKPVPPSPLANLADDLAATQELLTSMTNPKSSKRGELQDYLTGTFNEGMRRFQSSQFAAAIACFDIVAKQGTENVQTNALVMTARAMEGLGSIASSASTLEQAASLSSQPRLYRKAGLTYNKVRDYASSSRCFLKSLAVLGVKDPMDWKSCINVDSDVHTLSASGDILPPSEADTSSRAVLIAFNIISTAGVYTSLRKYDEALKYASCADEIICSPEYLASKPDEHDFIHLSLLEVTSECAAGASKFDLAKSSAVSAVHLAKRLSQPKRSAAMFASLGHIARIQSDDVGSRKYFKSAADNYIAAGSHINAGRLMYQVAKRQQQQNPLDDEAKKFIAYSLSQSLKSFQEARKGNPNDVNILRGEYESARALAFSYQTLFDYDSNDDVDVDNAASAFKSARTAAQAIRRAGGQPEVESEARVNMELGNCLVRRMDEGDIEMAEICFGEAAKLYSQIGMAREADIAKKSLETIRKQKER